MTRHSFAAGNGGAAHGAEVRLREAPARYFPDAWAKLVELTKGETQALHALDHPDPGFLAHYRRSSRSTDPQHKEEKIYELVQKIISNLCMLGAERTFLASGIYAQTGLHQDIPSGLWAATNAKIEFTTDQVALGEYKYCDVAVREPKASVAQDDLDKPIRDWLEERLRQRGAEKKQALLGAAREAFGDACTVRAFDAAYAVVYGRKRGRPRIMNK